jgi:PKD repeat protein
MKTHSKSRNLVLVTGLLLLTIVLPGIVSAGSISSPTAQFAANTLQGQYPLTVQFTSQSVSSGTTSYKWDMNNDGVIDYTTRNPLHTYTTAGNFTVSQMVTDAEGSEQVIKTNYIKVSAPVTRTPPVARFIANSTQGTNPLTVQFTDQSVSPGTASYSWDINDDGVVDYSARNPKHTYQTAGNYTVKLTVTNADGSDRVIKSDYIKVSAPVTTSSLLSTPSISVTTPDGGETWERGTTHTIAWSYTGNPGSTVKIVFLKGGIPVTLSESAPIGSGGKGSYTWSIWSERPTGSDYKVSVESTSQPTVKDISNNYFTIASGTITPGTPSVTPTPVIKTDNTITTSGSSTLYLDQYGIKGDGSDEGPAIQTALTYAASHSFKTVVFPAGKVITIGSLRIPEGLTLIGNGCTLKLKANAHTDTSPWTWIYVQEGVRVTGFKFDGNRLNGNGKNTNGLMLQGDNTFDNNEIFNVNSYAVFVYGSYPSNIRITNNYIHDIKQYGIDTGGSDGPSSWGYNVTVTGNTIANCGEVGIKIRGTKDSVISNNNVKVGARNTNPLGDEPSGIRLYSWDETNTNVKITNNIVTGIDQNPSACINSDDSDNHGISITGNKVSHCYDGIDIQFNNGIITGNTISNCVKDITNGGSGNTISNTILA